MKKILLVDPSSKLRSALAHVLEQNDHVTTHITEAENGAEGLQRLVGDADIALILSQLDLEFLEQVKRQTSVPVVVVSSPGQEHLLSEAISRGAQGYVNDPPSPEFLRLLVGELESSD